MSWRGRKKSFLNINSIFNEIMWLKPIMFSNSIQSAKADCNYNKLFKIVIVFLATDTN